ncbi:N-formylglutamate amidohydrolase [Qipengyuania sp. DGS5-3]|uniref:N-formylglutamate amidohydrolase n=1 Tax=Qipengyuania sp. DGS5-3 TaxID=3349632 RepID=UPI0036D3B743
MIMVKVNPVEAPEPGTRHGGHIPGTKDPAFTLNVPQSLAIPVVIAAPHGGRAYPDAIIAKMREPRWSMLRLEDRHVDTLAAEVATATGAILLSAHAPRAMLDLNRAADDVDWAMIVGGKSAGRAVSRANHRAKGGLGLVPRRLAGLGDIWREALSKEELEARIGAIHSPYHAVLGKTLEQLRERWGAALLIDLHSMPPLKPSRAHPRAAEFVIGDRFGASCHGFLADAALRHLANVQRMVAHNRPYSGGYVLDHHSAPRRNIHGLQLEVCRSIYLDARMEEPGPRLPAVARQIGGLVRDLAFETITLGGGEQARQAAE